MSMPWSPADAPDHATRESRVSKLLSLEISSDRLERSRVVVRNLSPWGIGMRGDVAVLPCERLTVHLPDGREIPSTVRWVRNGSFGVALDERIEPARLRVIANPTKTLPTRDSSTKFELLRHGSEPVQRSGFQRSHRDEVLNTSGWNRD